MKTKHAKAGLVNIMFMPGAGGTFLANMLSRAITDPWWNDYVPESPNELFKATNEFINPYNHIVMTWHPWDLKDAGLFKDTYWINLTQTPAELKFTDIMSAIKRQDYDGVTKKDILDRMYATMNGFYDKMYIQQGIEAVELVKDNTVINVKYSDIFVNGNHDVILSIINHVFNGQYVAEGVVANIAACCMAKHESDKHLWNELYYNTDESLDNIIEIAVPSTEVSSKDSTLS